MGKHRHSSELEDIDTTQIGGMDQTIDERYNEKYDYDPNFTGFDEERHCTDVCCRTIIANINCSVSRRYLYANRKERPDSPQRSDCG